MPHPPLGNPAAIPPKLQRRLDRNTRHPRSPNHGDRWIQTIEESATVVLMANQLKLKIGAGKRKARRSCGSAGLYRRILPERLEGAGDCDGGAGFFSPAPNPTPEAKRRRLINH